MAINKVEFGDQTLIDLTSDTVTQQDVLNGKSFHTPDGVQRSGTASIPVSDVTVDGTSVVNAQGVAEVTVPDDLADLADDSTHRTVTDTEKSTWSAKVSDNPTFTEASTRANIASGESFATILGKIKKFFTDLKSVAFSGAYADLSGTPTKLSDFTDDVGYLESSDITVTQVQSTGTKIATIDVDGTSTDLYAPAGGGGGSVNDVTVNGTSVVNAQGVAEVITSDRVAKSGDTMSGNLTVDRQNGTTSSEGLSYISIGNNIATGTNKNSTGIISLYTDKGTRTNVYANGTTATRNIGLPDASGTLVLENTIFPNNTWRAVGDDVQIGDRNTAGSLHIQGTNGTTNIRFHKYNDESNVGDFIYDGTRFALTKQVRISGRLDVERSDSDTILYLKGNDAHRGFIRFTGSDDSVIGYLGIDNANGARADVYFDGANHYLAYANDVIPYKTNIGIGRVMGDGTDAYCLIAEIKITGTYQNRPIYFEVSGRGYELSRLNVVFSNVNNTDPSLQIFTISQHRAIDDFKIFKTATSTWQLYCHIGQWGDIALHRISGLQSEICTPKMTRIYATALPVTWADGRVPTHGETFTDDVTVTGGFKVNNAIQIREPVNDKVVYLRKPTAVTDTRNIMLPNKDGTIALTSDISSRRYKENIIPLSEDEAKKILDVEIVNYDYKENVVDEDERYDQKGAIAEDVVNLIPNAVTYADIDGEQLPDGINYTKFIPYLIKMVQIQQKEIEELKAMIKMVQMQQKEIDQLKAEVAELKR